MDTNWPEARVASLPDLETGTSTFCAPAGKTEERRTLRRAKLRLRMRARPGEFDDGAFEEVANTQDASRKAFYFHTTSDRYRAGMRLHVKFPFDPHAHSTEADDIGEVLRVDQKANGYGVAVAFWKAGAEPTFAGRTAASSAKGERCGDAERRDHERHPLVAATELVDLPTGMRTRASTSDLSHGGCYVNTLNPFRLGTTLELKIEHSQGAFVAEACVCTRFEGSGMGLAFQNITPEQSAMLANWLPAADAVLADSVN
jgi:hypothetical protein